ncbi:hypothetical protein HG535_0D06020 [Zygotorulaspora mrakii]|uniref:Enoyl reductase (ER) domain-containing protein n=1 Tax=Zygotorulaspora mrakii TaxID=42260 RepID=A0A7H9B325_ZYGMR|nr:uncharacterized protein HG535_0D06020 [Zygotorulaspora mrakii]QLG72893.1 hypothetical protein HG535_0D06020 [Zygotorulaspora mrakii]
MVQAEQEAVILQKAGLITIGKRPIPEIEDPNDVKVQIKATGICGSDVHYYKTGAIGDFVVKEPMVLGHESSGVVVEVGSKVQNVKVGDRVAIEPGIPSRYSEETMSGHYNLCPHMRFCATPPYDGTLLKYFLVPKDFVYKLEDHVSFEEGAIVEPLSVAVHANKLAKTTFGNVAVVFGAGPVGLLTGATASAFGALEIVFIDIFEHKLERAKQFKATHALRWKPHEKEADIVKEISKALGGRKPDVVFECSGAESCIRAAVKVCNRGGSIVQVGMGKDDVLFPITELGVKELTFHGSFRYYKGDYKDAVSLITTGKIDVRPLITRRFPFAEAVEAYKYNVDHAAEITKTIIEGPE